MTASEWVECADPERLAAAVAACVRVEVSDRGRTWWASTCCTAEDFRLGIALGYRYRLPRSVSWRLDGEPGDGEGGGAIPADMTPDRLREAAGWVDRSMVAGDACASDLLRWADELEAAAPDPDVPFPVGARVVDEDGDIATVRGVHGHWRWLFGDAPEPWSYDVRALCPAPPPTVPVPADVVARAVAGTLTDDDRAALARAGEAA